MIKQLDTATIVVLIMAIFAIGILTGLLIAAIAVHIDGTKYGGADPGGPGPNREIVPPGTSLFGNPNQYPS